MRGSNARKAAAASADPDESAIVDALLADLAMLQDRFPTLSLHHYRILLEVIQAERRGTHHTIVSLARQVRLPMSSASRIVWQLTKEGGDVGLLRYERHLSDRRRKYVRMEKNGAGKVLPNVLVKMLTQSSRKGARA
jgi:DNA-binding MarR family transcriptional regulator